MATNFLVLTTGSNRSTNELFRSEEDVKSITGKLLNNNNHFPTFTVNDVEIYDEDYVALYLYSNKEISEVDYLLEDIGIKMTSPFEELERLLNEKPESDIDRTSYLQYQIVNNFRDIYLNKKRKDIISLSEDDSILRIIQTILIDNNHTNLFHGADKILNDIILTMKQFRTFRQSRTEYLGIDSLTNKDAIVSYIKNAFSVLETSTRKDLSILHTQMKALFHEMKFINQEVDRLNTGPSFYTPLERSFSFTKGNYFDVVELFFINLNNIVKDEDDSLLKRNTSHLRNAFINYYKYVDDMTSNKDVKSKCTDSIITLCNFNFSNINKYFVAPKSENKMELKVADNSGMVNSKILTHPKISNVSSEDQIVDLMCSIYRVLDNVMTNHPDYDIVTIRVQQQINHYHHLYKEQNMSIREVVNNLANLTVFNYVYELFVMGEISDIIMQAEEKILKLFAYCFIFPDIHDHFSNLHHFMVNVLINEHNKKRRSLGIEELTVANLVNI